MDEQGSGGVIVNVASIYGMRAPRFEIYDGTALGMPCIQHIKAGIINYSRQLAIYADQGVRVNCVSQVGFKIIRTTFRKL